VTHQRRVTSFDRKAALLASERSNNIARTRYTALLTAPSLPAILSMAAGPTAIQLSQQSVQHGATSPHSGSRANSLTHIPTAYSATSRPHR